MSYESTMLQKTLEVLNNLIIPIEITEVDDSNIGKIKTPKKENHAAKPYVKPRVSKGETNKTPMPVITDEDAPMDADHGEYVFQELKTAENVESYCEIEVINQVQQLVPNEIQQKKGDTSAVSCFVYFLKLTNEFLLYLGITST